MPATPTRDALAREPGTTARVRGAGRRAGPRRGARRRTRGMARLARDGRRRARRTSSAPAATGSRARRSPSRTRTTPPSARRRPLASRIAHGAAPPARRSPGAPPSRPPHRRARPCRAGRRRRRARSGTTSPRAGTSRCPPPSPRSSRAPAPARRWTPRCRRRSSRTSAPTSAPSGCTRAPRSAAAAAELHARAFTVGADIFLGDGESSADLELMAHEATHVVQQQAVAVYRDLEATDLIPDWIIDGVTSAAREIPGYTLLTVITGKDPLTDEPATVSRTEFVEKLLTFGPVRRRGRAAAADHRRPRRHRHPAHGRARGPQPHAVPDRQRHLAPRGTRWGSPRGSTATSRSSSGTWTRSSPTSARSSRTSSTPSSPRSARSPPTSPSRCCSARRSRRTGTWRRRCSTTTRCATRTSARRRSRSSATSCKLAGRDEVLAQMTERGTLQETADWLDQQWAVFTDLLGRTGALFADAWAAISPENLPNLIENLTSLADRAFTLAAGRRGVRLHDPGQGPGAGEEVAPGVGQRARAPGPRLPPAHRDPRDGTRSPTRPSRARPRTSSRGSSRCCPAARRCTTSSRSPA